MEEGINAGGAASSTSQSELLPTDSSAAGNGSSKTWRLNSLPKASGFFSRNIVEDAKGKLSTSGLANWAKNLKLNANSGTDDSGGGKSSFSLLSASFGKRSPENIPVVDAPPPDSSSDSSLAEGGRVNTITKGLLDSSRNAMKAVQTKARHLVSQNKRRFQEDGFDLDMTYITDNIIAMGFPAGDMSSGLLGFVEGFYRNHMEEVIRFFESRHKGKYKVYNLCSERLYDAALLEGKLGCEKYIVLLLLQQGYAFGSVTNKVACFPFDDHNCPPLHLVEAFCQSSYSWLKADLENVVVVHCKAGMGRTGLMISSLLLHLKFFPTAEESISYYNQKRCVDSKGLVLPSQLRYVTYYERVLRNCNGETPRGRKVVLRGFRLHKCPYWIRPAITIWDHNGLIFSSKKHPRTKDMMPEDYWFNAPRKGVIVFALPGERGIADLDGDFKVQFHDGHGDFYCWHNTSMMENRTFLSVDDLDGFDKRKLPSPGFQVEMVVVDLETFLASKQKADIPTTVQSSTQVAESLPTSIPTSGGIAIPTGSTIQSSVEEKDDDVFSDSESEGGKAKALAAKEGEALVRHDGDSDKRVPPQATIDKLALNEPSIENKVVEGVNSGIHPDLKESLNASPGRQSRGDSGGENKTSHGKASTPLSTNNDTTTTTTPSSDFKAIAADASVFTFGDDEDYESD